MAIVRCGAVRCRAVRPGPLLPPSRLCRPCLHWRHREVRHAGKAQRKATTQHASHGPVVEPWAHTHTHPHAHGKRTGLYFPVLQRVWYRVWCTVTVTVTAALTGGREATRAAATATAAHLPWLDGWLALLRLHTLPALVVQYYTVPP